MMLSKQVLRTSGELFFPFSAEHGAEVEGGEQGGSLKTSVDSCYSNARAR
jgi:hypothetical protein